jgi:adenine C2-methylase RlmN of 23S rRNA A2503 and tRNA A37
MTELNLWCYVKGASNFFKVSILSSQDINDLQERIHAKKPNAFAKCDADDLKLTLVRCIMISV